MPLLYLDTNVVVSFINPRDALHSRAVSLVSRARSSGYRMVVSDLTVVELASVFSRVTGASEEEAEALVEYSLEAVRAERRSVDCDRLFMYALLYAPRLRLRTLDLLHVVSARLLGAEAIATFDREIAARSELLRELLGVQVIG